MDGDIRNTLALWVAWGGGGGGQSAGAGASDTPFSSDPAPADTNQGNTSYAMPMASPSPSPSPALSNQMPLPSLHTTGRLPSFSSEPFSELPKNLFLSPLLRDSFARNKMPNPNIRRGTGLPDTRVADSGKQGEDAAAWTPRSSRIAGDVALTPTHSAFTPHHGAQPPGTPRSNRITGEVAFTPTHSAFTPHHGVQSFNVHSAMVPQTPVGVGVVSGPGQAKNSIKLQNCVSTVNLSCELKLLDIYCRTRHSEYNPSRFNGVIMRILEPKATALVFRSGKLVCTGTKNEQDSLLAARKFSRIIQKLGYPVKFVDFKMQNFVATADLRFPIKLESLQQTHGQFTSYEPELFPGLVYRMIRPRIVLLIFVNGKIVFTGAKSQEDITDSLSIIYPILKSFKKN